MKTCSKCKIEKELTEFSNNKTKRDGKETICKTCTRLRTRAWQKANKERTRARVAKYRATDKGQQKTIEYRQANRHKMREYCRQHYVDNMPKYRAKCRLYQAKKLQATPHWLTKKDHDRIKHIYWMADLITKITGEQHHVDHITPLQGENVCGLHVPENLQILTATENLSKGNKWTT